MVDFTWQGAGLSISGVVVSVFLLFTLKPSSPPQQDHSAHEDNFRVVGPAYPIQVNVGEDALLTCHLLPKKNAAQMEVTWYRSDPNTPVFAYRDGAEVTEMQKEEYRGRVEWVKDNIIEGHVALKMYNIQPSDSGQFWCRFQEENYQREASLLLQVISVGSSPKVYMRGSVESGLHLVCTSKGWFPEPNVLWEGSHGEELLTFSKHLILDEDGLFYVESMLVVGNVSLETVSCSIHSHELNKQNSTLSIPEKSQTELASLNVIGPSQPILVRVGEDIHLPCHLSPKTSAESMEVSWVRDHRYPPIYMYVDGHQVTEEQMSEYRGRTALVTDSLHEGKATLLIHKASISDDGQYRCLFEKDGVYQEASLELKVAGLGSSPLITMERLKEGEVDLRCTSEGWFPQPHAQWRDMEGNLLIPYSEVLSADSQGFFHMETHLILKTDPVVNVTCSISNLLLDEEKMAIFYLSDIIVTESWKVLPYVLIIAEAGGVLTLIIVCGKVLIGLIIPTKENLLNKKDKNDREKELQEQNDKLQKEIDRRKAQFKLVWRKAPLYPDWRKEYFKSVNVTLDAATAHHALHISEKGKQVTWQGMHQDLPSSKQRFDSIPCVLGQQAITSGRCYWEVKVEDANSWDLGICRDNATRKGKITVSPQNGFWVIRFYNGEYWAITSPETPLTLEEKPLTVGIFIDYEVGEVAFYNMTDGVHIFTFSQDTFSGALRPLLRLWSSESGSLTIVQEKNKN